MGTFDNVTFRSFDYEGFKQSLFDLAVTLKPKWTDTLESNQGIAFVEWVSYVGGSLCFSQNFHARQCFVPTVTEAKNLRKLAKQYDYTIANNVASSVDVTFSQADGDALTADLVIPEGTEVKTTGSEPEIFEVSADTTLPSGSISVDVPCRNWQSRLETNTSDGSSDQSFTLSYESYVDDTISVTVDSVAWSAVDNFLDSSSTSTHYRIEVDSDGVVTVIFGDNTNGKIPSDEAALEFSYKTGGGAIGNVAADTITIIEETLIDTAGNPVDLEVTNAAAATGGVDSESITTTKLRLPDSIAAKDASINESAIETTATSVSGIARAKSYTVNEDSTIPENTALIIVIPDSGDTLSASVETLLDNAFETNPTTLTLNRIVAVANFVEIEIDIRDLVLESVDNDGAYATATVTITDNSFDSGDTITVNGVDFEESVDWSAGGDTDASATNLATAIAASSDPLLQDITASAVGSVVTISARTTGQHGNDYTLAETDGATDNFTLSGSTLENGEDSTTQAEIREAIDTFFGRTNVDEDGNYTVGIGQTVYENRLIWLIDDNSNVEDFTLNLPTSNTTLEKNEFPTYSLKFTTSV